jgi:DNA replication and repair protein RecF
MPLKRLQLKNFRLFQDNLFTFSDRTNLILGENGSGKTSILESISILLLGSSFRTKETKECINSSKNSFSITGKGTLDNKELALSVNNGLNKRVNSSRKIEGASVKKEELYFLQIVMSKNLRMIDGEPEIRRDYFHELMFHVKPATKKLYIDYQRALKQRNKCLKKNLSKSELSIWSKELAELGLALSLEQYGFFKSFKQYNIQGIEDIVKSGEFTFLDNFNVTFSKGWERSKKLEESFEDSLEKDKAIGYTSKGPHRMDITFQVNNKKAASNLSRGQLKILILLIFLTNIKLIKQITQRETLLMIDDLGSELDIKNLRSLIEQIILSENQIVLTGIEGEEMHQSIKKLTNFTQINL